MEKGVTVFNFLIESMLTIFLILFLAYVLVPVIYELTPNYLWIFYSFIAFVILLIILTFYKRLR
jgi:L-asparagine transporter-like permease